MTPAHRRYLVLEQGVGGAILNFVLNAAIAWGLFRSLATIPLWGSQSIAGDTIATGFILPFLTCMIVTPLARREVRRGRFGPVALATQDSLLARLPARTWQRAVVIGLVGAGTAAPVMVLLLAAGGVTAMPFWPFIGFKATFAAALGAVIGPLVALAALADTPLEQRRAA